jgi:hypothetical protein
VIPERIGPTGTPEPGCCPGEMRSLAAMWGPSTYLEELTALTGPSSHSDRLGGL